VSTIPIITGYGGEPVRAGTLLVTGSGFGRVSSAALVDVNGRQWMCAFQIGTGSWLHLTIPQLLPDGSYLPTLGTLDNTVSQNLAGPITLPLLDVAPPVRRTAPEPVPDPASPAMIALRKRVRLEIGDFEERFQSSVQGDGFTRRFDLPVEVIDPTSISVVLQLEDAAAPSFIETFDLDAQAGVLTLPTPPENDSILTVTGRHHQFFTNAELDLFVRSAALKHTHSSEDLQVYRDTHGFKRFLYTNQTVDSIPPVEYHLVALLSAIEALEVIRSDAAYDIDVNTAEGTMLPRSERFRNLGELIATKQVTYDELAQKLGVGLGKIEVFTMRRVSRTTGKLVPVYVAREYDEVRVPPLRVFGPRNKGLTGSGFAQPDPRYLFAGYSAFDGEP
jgi:hypothetical protein